MERMDAMQLKVSFALLLIVVVAVGSLSATGSQAQPAGGAGAVFVMTNSADKNEIIAYKRAVDGTLQAGRTFVTGGRGSGGVTDPLSSQGSLILSQDHSLLFAANAGSGDISVFRVHGSALTLVDKVASGGSGPNAVAQHRNLVYVLNAGGGSNVTGFFLEKEGKLS